MFIVRWTRDNTNRTQMIRIISPTGLKWWTEEASRRLRAGHWLAVSFEFAQVSDGKDTL